MDLLQSTIILYNGGEAPTTDQEWRAVWCEALAQFNMCDSPVLITAGLEDNVSTIMAAAITNALIDECSQCCNPEEFGKWTCPHVSAGHSWQHIATTLVNWVLEILA